MEGTASVVEGNVQIVVRNARGEVAGQGFATATVGAPGRGDYAAGVAFSVSGRQNGVVEIFSPDARDGRPLHMVTVPVVLVPN